MAGIKQAVVQTFNAQSSESSELLPSDQAWHLMGYFGKPDEPFRNAPAQRQKGAE